jgi:hypothetical protein
MILKERILGISNEAQLYDGEIINFPNNSNQSYQVTGSEQRNYSGANVTFWRLNPISRTGKARPIEAVHTFFDEMPGQAAA